MTSSTKDDVETDTANDKLIKKVTFDTVLLEIGQFGRFQIKVLILAAIIAIFGTWGATEYVFTTARIKTRCLIPECDGPNPEFSPPWLQNAVPSSPSGVDGCHRFQNLTQLTPGPGPSCPAELFNTSQLVPCDAYVYENTHSSAYDFNLACAEWRRTLMGSLRTLGAFLALPFTGYVSDRWGRRAAVTVTATSTAVLGLLRYWVNSYAGFVVSEVVETIFGGGAYNCAFILITEVIVPKYRVLASAFLNISLAVAQILLGLIAWNVPNWRNLTLALYAPMLITISYFWLLTESARWYMSKGRFDEAEAVLQKIAKTNGKTISKESLEGLKQTFEERQKKEESTKEKVKEPWLIVLVYRHKRVLFRCVATPIWWLTTTLVYQGLMVNSVNLTGNIYLNFALVAAVDIPGYCSAMFGIHRVGRKPVLTGALWICSASQLVYVFLPRDRTILMLTFYLIGKFCIAAVMMTVYLYTAELFPTRHRNTLFAFSSMMGRVGAMMAPLTPAFGAATFEQFPFIIFACFALLSGILIFFTPETLGTTMPDTMEEAENLGRKKPVVESS